MTSLFDRVPSLRPHRQLASGRGLAAALAALALAACSPAPKAPPPAKPAKPAVLNEGAVRQAFTDSQASGLVIAVVDKDQVWTRGFGRMGPNDPRVPDGKTLVRLQSVSKLLAADVLSRLAWQGKVRLTDPLQLYAPPGDVVPTAKDQPPIELVNLATHTSGLPRVADIRADLADGPALAARWGWLVTQTKLPGPGKVAAYSNLAFDLLGDALANAARAPYPALLRAQVTAPLGMADTTPAPNAEQCARMMASDPNRRRWPCVDQTAEAASGGIYSTADDMALWLKAQLAPGADADQRRVSQAVYFPREALNGAVGIDHAGRASAVGLAWIELAPSADHPRLLQKTGGGDGFLTYLVIDPAKQIGVFVGFDNVSGHKLETIADDADAIVAGLGAQ